MKVRSDEKRGGYVADCRVRGEGPQTFHRTREEAELVVAKAKLEASMTPTIAPKNDSKMTLAVYGKMKLDATSGSVCGKSSRKYERTFVNHILPYIGNLPMRELTPEVVEKFIVERRDDPKGNRRTKNRPLHPGTLKDILVVLQKICKKAVKERILLGGNPVVGVGRDVYGKKSLAPRAATSTKVHWMDDEKLRAFFSMAKRMDQEGDLEFFDAFYVLSETGMRLGELLGLRASDIDLVKRRIRVERQATGDTKTESSVRWIPVSPSTCDFLRRVIARSREVGFKQGKKSGTWLFAPTLSDFPTEQDVNTLQGKIRRHMAAVCERAGLPRMTPHGFRHTLSSRVLANGYPVEWLQAVLGHRSIKTTIDTYDRWRTKEAPAGAVETLTLGETGEGNSSKL